MGQWTASKDKKTSDKKDKKRVKKDEKRDKKDKKTKKRRHHQDDDDATEGPALEEALERRKNIGSQRQTIS